MHPWLRTWTAPSRHRRLATASSFPGPLDWLTTGSVAFVDSRRDCSADHPPRRLFRRGSGRMAATPQDTSVCLRGEATDPHCSRSTEEEPQYHNMRNVMRMCSLTRALWQDILSVKMLSL